MALKVKMENDNGNFDGFFFLVRQMDSGHFLEDSFDGSISDEYIQISHLREQRKIELRRKWFPDDKKDTVDFWSIVELIKKESLGGPVALTLF